MKHIVLVHGSWYGSWCWDRVADKLRAQGYHVSAPDLPAHGRDETPIAQVSLAGYAERVARAIDETGADKAVVVGHSMAGAVLSELAERHPDKVERLVYLAAYLLGDGESIFQHAASDADSALGPSLRPDESRGVIAVVDEGFSAALASGCSAADVELARKQARPDPLAPLATPIHVTAERFGKVPRVYIKTTEDKAVSTSLQTKLLGATPTPTVELASGHSPFLSHVDALVSALGRAME
ncbi:MAG: alpha/beta fold hydrolase [Polyangiaceae bacterium]